MLPSSTVSRKFARGPSKPDDQDDGDEAACAVWSKARLVKNSDMAVDNLKLGIVWSKGQKQKVRLTWKRVVAAKDLLGNAEDRAHFCCKHASRGR